MSESKTCATCPARLAADQLDLQAGLADEIGAEQSADAMRSRAAEIRAAGCLNWWRLDEENEDTGQKRTREGCGREWLPMFLRSFGLDVARTANVIRSDHEELTRVAIRAGSHAVRLREAMHGAVLADRGNPADPDALAGLDVEPHAVHEHGLGPGDGQQGEAGEVAVQDLDRFTLLDERAETEA